jgi:hypothetical protein
MHIRTEIPVALLLIHIMCDTIHHDQRPSV